MDRWLSLIITRKKGIRKALFDPCHDLRELPANDDVPLLSDVPLRISGFYPNGIIQNSAQSNVSGQSKRGISKWFSNWAFYQPLGLVTVIMSACLVWSWIIFSGMLISLSSFSLFIIMYDLYYC